MEMKIPFINKYSKGRLLSPPKLHHPLKDHEIKILCKIMTDYNNNCV